MGRRRLNKTVRTDTGAVKNSVLTCQYILNNQAPWSFCKKKAVAGRSWCEEHNKVCYIRKLEPVA
jgi:hypothetical protein